MRDEELGGILPHTKWLSAIHIRVPTELQMNNRQTTGRRNELEGTVKTLKKPEQSAVDAEVGRLAIGMNTMGSSEVDLVQMSRSAVSNLASLGHAGTADIASTIASVRSLAPDVGHGDDDEKKAPENPEEEQEEEEKGKAKPGEKSWWPREASILTAERKAEGDIADIKKELKDCQTYLLKQHQDQL